MPIPERESFENGFYYFVQALGTLAKDAQEQCDAMGNYNTSWEMKHDVLNGKYLLENKETSLTEREATAIRKFLVGVEQIPEGLLATTSPREGNLRVMSDTMWEPLRLGARDLLVTLADAIARNHEYLWSERGP